jgi:iron only hydrogenase large subunit-like protein
VAKAVSNCLGQQHPVKPLIIQGIDKESIRHLKMLAKRPDEHNFIEVMNCANGCIGGGSNLAKPTVAKRQIENFIQKENKLEQ